MKKAEFWSMMDLIGLPPTPVEVAEFLADGRPDAYGHLGDQLLASPQYGEKWARHWMDLAHYLQTAMAIGMIMYARMPGAGGIEDPSNRAV